MRELRLEEIRVLNNRLAAFDQSWVKTKESFGNKPSTKYLDHATITQILKYATYGITTWDFAIEKEWREEIHKKDKGSNQWIFDGYVYHVKATLTIDGLGSRTQFGKKVATGGATGQDMSYQSAASNALSKCASLFGIGETLYVPQNQIISAEFAYEETERLLGHLQKPVQQQLIQQSVQPLAPQQPVEQQIAHFVDPVIDGVNNMFATQQQVQQQAEQQVQQIQQQAPQQQQQQQQWDSIQNNAFVNNGQQNNQQPAWGGQNVEQQLPGGFDGQQQQQAQAQWESNTQTWVPQENMNSQPTQQDQQFMQENNVPFGNAQPQMGNQPQVVDMPQPQVMGPPINVQQEPKQVEQEQVQVQGSDEQQKFMQQITFYKAHMSRLGLTDDSQMMTYLRDFFKDENASTANLNMETIVGFNEYMNTIQV